MLDTLYKVLDDGLRSMHGGAARWVIDAWQPPVTDPALCERGYHLCREADLTSWLGPVIGEAEARGTRIDGDDKVVVAEARIVRRVETWTETTARLYAADCAEHVAHRAGQGVAVCRATIAVARRFARGEATPEELCAARGAARVAAWSVAWSAEESAARSAAWCAEWSAAWSAARGAAWSAAESAARSVAWCAAWDSEERAARSVAWSVEERQWQTARLMQYLRGDVT